jgi:hypothetical protein
MLMIHSPLPLFFFYKDSSFLQLLLRSSIGHRVIALHMLALVDEICALEKLEYLVDQTVYSLVMCSRRGMGKEGGNLHDRRTDPQHGFPLADIQRNNAEQALQERNIQERKVERHTERDSRDEHGISP